MGGAQNKDAKVSAKDTLEIMSNMWHESLKDDPYAWVMYAFPWGVKGTPLENKKGPRKWQKQELQKIAVHIRENKKRVARGEKPLVYKFAMASGRGPGKSALVAMVTLWFMSCVLGGTTILSANNDTQLSGKTFGEIGKWRTMCLSGYWFEPLTKKLTPQAWLADELARRLQIDSTYYYAEGVLWNEDNPDAFAGAHNTYGMLLIFDEASGIPEPIWKVSRGFFTEDSIYRFWFVFSNPRRNTGPFFDCFHSDSKFWNTRQLDSREAEVDDVSELLEIISKYGEDSDEAAVEVKGQFPKQGDKQFISREVVHQATRRDLISDPNDVRYDRSAPLVIGCDPARYGGDKTVIRIRQGRDARSFPAIEMSGADNMKVANKLAELIDLMDPDAVFVDSGAGAGIIDRLREMKYKIHEVGFGSVPDDAQYADRRTELWGKMRDWLRGSMIDDHAKLKIDLCAPEFEFTGKASDKIKLESKEKMKKRGIASPDHADALAVTFDANIARKDRSLSNLRGGARQRPSRAANALRS